jgi:polysaccharide pyruvyl transferase WcaK-like protein
VTGDVVNRSSTIGIIGHVGNSNLGDEAIIAALIENMRSRVPECDFVAFTTRPDDTATRHGVSAFPLRRMNSATAPPPAVGQANNVVSAASRLRSAIRRVPPLFHTLKLAINMVGSVRGALLEIVFLVRSYRRLSRVSLLVIAGSQQLSDAVGGCWGFPYTVFKWSLLARVRGIPVAIVSVGAGPLISTLSRWFVRRTVWMAEYRSYRDDVSRTTVRDLGIQDPGDVVGDLAFSLPSEDNRATPLSDTVVINPMPFVWQDYDERTERRLYERYIVTLASFIVWLRERGYAVRLVPTQLRTDPIAIDDVERRVHELRPDASDRVRVAHVATLTDLLAILNSVRFVVATRFHGAVLACYAARPVLALAYHPKTYDLMAQVGQPQCALPAQDLRLESLQAAFIDLETRADRVAEGIAAHVQQVRQKLAGQYEQLEGLVALSARNTSLEIDTDAAETF